MSELEGGESSAVTAGRQVTIDIDQGGKFQLAGKSLDKESLIVKLRGARAKASAKLMVLLRVDDCCPFQHVAKVLSACQQLGITDISVGSRAQTASR